MGTFLEAVCPCGYQSGADQGWPALRFGRQTRTVRSPNGRLGFEPWGPDWWPAQCLKCRSVFSIGRADEAPLCPHCSASVHFYDEPGLYAVPEGASRAPRWDRQMLLLSFHCPVCQRFEMRFRSSRFGSFD